MNPVNRHLASPLADRRSVPDGLQAVLKYRAERTLEDLQDIEEVVVLVRSRSGSEDRGSNSAAPGAVAGSQSSTPHGLYFRLYRAGRVGEALRDIEEARLARHQTLRV